MKKGEQTRQEIIRKAAPVFNQRGFAGASMNDIMQATGLEKGGLYRHFTCKQQLATEAFRYTLEQAVERRTAHLAEIPNAVEKLRHMIKAFVETPSPVPGGCPLMNTFVDADDTNPELRELARKGVAAWKSRIASIVSSGIERGEIRPDTAPSRIANLIVANLEGALLISRLEGAKEALHDAQSALGTMLDTICTARALAPTPAVR